MGETQMTHITIDGKEIEVDSSLTILEAAQKADIKIPTLCYLKEVNEIGACKMCVVEVEGKNHLVTSCNTKVAEGMQIHTKSDKVVRSRKQVLNLLLAEIVNLSDASHAANPATAAYRICLMSMALPSHATKGMQRSSHRRRRIHSLTYYPELCINCQKMRQHL